jgi:hypothetical protein
VFKGAVQIEDLFAVLLAVLELKRSEGFLESVTMNEENTQWVEAIKWMEGDLKKITEAAKKD